MCVQERGRDRKREEKRSRKRTRKRKKHQLRFFDLRERKRSKMSKAEEKAYILLIDDVILQCCKEWLIDQKKKIMKQKIE